MKQTRFILDLIPALFFFAAYFISNSNIYTATTVLVAALVSVVVFCAIFERRLHTLHLVTALLVGILGGLTLYFHDPRFIKYKPTVMYALFACIMFSSHFIGTEVILKRLLKSGASFEDALWRRMNIAWGVFFLFCALLNVYVVQHASESTWVTFKVFGLPALIFVFILCHIPFLSRIEQKQSE